MVISVHVILCNCNMAGRYLILILFLQPNQRGRVSKLLHSLFLMTFCVSCIITRWLDYSSHIFTFARISCQLPVSGKAGLDSCSMHRFFIYELLSLSGWHLYFIPVCLNACSFFFLLPPAIINLLCCTLWDRSVCARNYLQICRDTKKKRVFVFTSYISVPSCDTGLDVKCWADKTY